MFTCNLDPKSKVPLYQQLYEYIQNSINNGELKAEEKLPSKRKMCIRDSFQYYQAPYQNHF